MPRSLLLLLLLFAACSEPRPPQIFLFNSSFEGRPAAGQAPDGWTNCGGGDESPTDIQPGFFGVSLPAAEGRTYLSMVVRETGKLEGLSQALLSPMKPGAEHRLWLSLAQSDSYASPALDLETAHLGHLCFAFRNHGLLFLRVSPVFVYENDLLKPNINYPQPISQLQNSANAWK